MLFFQVQKAWRSHRQDLQQNSTRQISLGYRYGYRGLPLLEQYTFKDVGISRPINNYNYYLSKSCQFLYIVIIIIIGRIEYKNLHFVLPICIQTTFYTIFLACLRLVFQLFNFFYILSCLNYRFLSFGIRQYVIV